MIAKKERKAKPAVCGRYSLPKDYRKICIHRMLVVVFVLGVMATVFSPTLNAETSVEWVYPFADGEEWIDHDDDWRKLDPATVSEQDFYRTEYAIIAGYSGSGGYFLLKEQIAWLSKAVRSFKTRGIAVRDRWVRRNVYRDSFYHLRRNSEFAA